MRSKYQSFKELIKTITKEDLDLLEKWKDKSINSNFYKEAVNTWSITDVKKINCFKEKGLNYIIYYKNPLIK